MGILKFAVRDLANFRIGEKKMIRDRNLMLGFLFDAREYIIVIPGFASQGDVAQWLWLRIADRKVSSSSSALPTVLRVRVISNLSSHTVHSAECTGNCA